MKEMIVCFTCTLAMLVFVLPGVVADSALNDTNVSTGSNATENLSLNETQATNPLGNAERNGKVLRAGFEKTKPLNNLDVYGNKSVHELGDNSKPSDSAFNASQRLGNVSKFDYSTSNAKPLYNVSEYSRTKPTYQVPSSSSSKPVYDIEKYSTIKAPASIP